jgi:hypothetical protein
MQPFTEYESIYTGDDLNPLVIFLEKGAGLFEDASVTVEIERPDEGTGNVLAASGLVPGTAFPGDAAGPRIQALQELITTPFPTTTVGPFPLFDDVGHGDQGIEPDGIWGNPLQNITLHEGSYTMTARAEYRKGSCTSSRETAWTVHVPLGIDPSLSGATASVGPMMPDGRYQVQIELTPRDVHGNYLGPGRIAAFGLAGLDGTELIGGLIDLGDGTYRQEAAWDSALSAQPVVEITQQNRAPVVVTTLLTTLVPLLSAPALIIILAVIGIGSTWTYWTAQLTPRLPH